MAKKKSGRKCVFVEEGLHREIKTRASLRSVQGGKECTIQALIDAILAEWLAKHPVTEFLPVAAGKGEG
jgi:hypothetical protein